MIAELQPIGVDAFSPVCRKWSPDGPIPDHSRVIWNTGVMAWVNQTERRETFVAGAWRDTVSRRDAKTEMYEQFARAGKGLANAKRLELLDLLAQGERSVDSLARSAGLGVSTASMHLQALKDAGFVRTRRDGTFVYYRVAGDDVAALLALLRTVATGHLADADRAAIDYLGTDSGEETEQVQRDELLARVRSGSAVVLDVRPSVEFAAGHIPGAVSVPLDRLEDYLDGLPADVEVVAYCRGAYCVLAYEAVRALTAAGRTARRLQDGMVEWRLAGLPVEIGPAA